MKFILLYRGQLGNNCFQVFDTREQAQDWAKKPVMADKEIFGVFELDSPVYISAFFNNTSVGRSE